MSALNETAPPTPKEEVFLVQKISLVLAMAAVIVMLFATAALAQSRAAGGGTDVAQPPGGGGGGGGGATATAPASPTAAATAQYAQYNTATPTALAPTGGPSLRPPFALVAALALTGSGLAALVFLRRGLT